MTLRNDLCSRHCSYYKPGKNEELGCMGFLVLERLIFRGKKISILESHDAVSADTAAALGRVLCERCPFFREGCDFAAKLQASPCGGFLVLGRLVDGGNLLLDDLRDMD